MGIVRESYRTLEAAIDAVDNHKKNGVTAYIAETHPKINKFVVERISERTI